MEFIGKIISISEIKTLANGKEAQDIVIQDEEKFPNSIVLNQYDKTVGVFKNYNVGDKVKTQLNFRTSEYNGRIFQKISSRKVEKLSSGKQDNEMPR